MTTAKASAQNYSNMRGDYSMSKLPPAGHADVGPFMYELFSSAMMERDRLNMPDKLLHMERSLFSRIPLGRRQLQVLYWGTPVVFSEADLEGGLLVGDTVRMTFSGGIGILENPVAELPVVDQLKEL